MTDLIYSVLPNPRRPITYVSPDFPVSKCIEMMVNQDIGALVVHDGANLLGLVSERDIVRSCIYAGLNPKRTKAADIAYTRVSVLALDDSVEKAMEVISKTKRRHVLITDKDELVAILSIGDVLIHLLESKAHIIEQLQNYISTGGTCEL